MYNVCMYLCSRQIHTYKHGPRTSGENRTTSNWPRDFILFLFACAPATAMRCDAMRSDAKRCDAKPRDGLQCDGPTYIWSAPHTRTRNENTPERSDSIVETETKLIDRSPFPRTVIPHLTENMMYVCM